MRRRHHMGYIVWGVAFVVMVVPELMAAWRRTEQFLPFPTISRTIGHLEVMDPKWEIFPTVLIVLFVYALLRSPIPAVGAQADAEDDRGSSGGGDEARRTFLLNAALAGLFLAAVGIVAGAVWPNQKLAGGTHNLPNFYAAYAFWGAAFVVWVMLPTATAVFGREHSFTSLPNTVKALIVAIGAGNRFRRGVAWTLGFVLVWGMAFLLLHLTLYPFPDITRQLNHSEVVCNGKIVSRLPHDQDKDCHKGDYPPGNGG